MILNKTFRYPLYLAIVFFFFTGINLAKAQQKEAAHYWTIENNIKDKSYTIVRYYNDEDQVVFEKVLKNKFIKLNKRDVRKLNKGLNAYNQQVKQDAYLAKRK
ncbi:MAG: hypothetical protein RIG77_01945 [Cyclobacteriaceae bacterium]